MTSHTVNSYDKDLQSITSSIVDMGRLVIELIGIARESLTHTDKDYIESAKLTDKKINNYDIDIERKAIALIALRQPMAIDLRLAISSIKIAVIMERMGDLAKNTVKRMAKIDIEIPADIEECISQMFDIIIEMFDNVLAAFCDNDDERALAICEQDDIVDELYHKLTKEIEKKMEQMPEQIPSFMQIVMSVKNIERIGDYVTKFAKILHYIVCGERAIKMPKHKTHID